MPQTGGSPRSRPTLSISTLDLLAFNVHRYWMLFWTQPLSYRLACAFVFFEYYRPQSIYPVLAIVPWSTLCLFGGIVALGSEGALNGRGRSSVGALLLLFAAVVLASSLVAWQPSLSWEQWALFWLWLPTYLLITRSISCFSQMIMFMALWALWNAKMSLSGIKQWAGHGFHFVSWGVLGSPGPFSNSGEFSIEMVIFFSVLVMILTALWPRLSTIKRMLIGGVVLSAAFSVVASSSRGAMGALALSSFWIVMFTRHRVRALIGVAGLGAVLYFATPPEFKERFRTVGEDQSSIKRALYRQRGLEMIRSFPWLGIGYGNWMGYYTNRYGQGGQVSHNIYIQAGAELGLLGLGAFLLLVLSGFLANRHTRILSERMLSSGAEHARLLRNLAIGLDAGQIGFLGAGYFVTVLYYPFFWMSLAFTVALHGVALQESQSLLAAQASPSRLAEARSMAHQTARSSRSHQLGHRRRG